MIKQCILENDPQLQIEPQDFSEEAYLNILVRERVKSTKLGGNYKRIKGKNAGQGENTITMLPKSGKPVTISKQDVSQQMRQGPAKEKKQKSQKFKKGQ